MKKRVYRELYKEENALNNENIVQSVEPIIEESTEKDKKKVEKKKTTRKKKADK